MSLPRASPVSIFRAGPGDAELARQAVVELHERVLLDPAALGAFLSDPACYLLIATDDGRVAGSLNGYALRKPHRHEPQFLLYEIDVRPGYRNRGVGKALVRAFTAAARDAGAYEVWVLTNASNEPALAMYRGCGFRRLNADDVMLDMELE